MHDASFFIPFSLFTDQVYEDDDDIEYMRNVMNILSLSL